MRAFEDEDLLRLMRGPEDYVVERKSKNDTKDFLKTLIAFANSMPIGYPAVLFIGVGDDREMEGNVDVDRLQRRLAYEAAEVFPPIYYMAKGLKQGDKECLAVIIPGSADRPHFAGQSYVRVGSESLKASERQFESLIAERNSKVYEIRKWIGKEVSITTMGGPALRGITVLDCGLFYMTYREEFDSRRMVSVPLERLQLSYDHTNARLWVYARDFR